ncbi:MAG: phosphate transport system regulatory protein PhoU [Caldimicrobium thiodismutans]|uniref:Phosphate-specific transport system accessory protein PhoU homolog n=1 Tax=Caldimicrobium thiodismutans TaxID=1653476 RepID=A0A2N7PLF4_9BACT|nr:MAG: phosphate transport system regulatory protein PhoU [Caldimicrobium thiodismutans]
MVRLALERDLQILKNLLLDMATSVSEMTSGAILAFEKLEEYKAKKVIEFDNQIDYMEHMVTLTALEIVALQQPVAKDLRFIVSSIDIARNLERLADQAVNIAERVANLLKYKDHLLVSCKLNILDMAREALLMLENAINAFISEDTEKARRVIAHDDVVDELKREYIKQIKDCMRGDPLLVDAGVEYIIVVQNLERVADLACNIAEGVIFTVEGKMPKIEKVTLPTVHELLLKELPVFDYLLKHARLVLECIERLPLAFEAYFKQDKSRLEEIVRHIIEIEREADKIKTNIRGHLPKGLILPVEKFELFLYLKEQDAIADSAEQILTWLSFKEIKYPEEFSQKLEDLLLQSIEPLKYFEDMIKYSGDFLITWNEDSRNRAKELIRAIRYKEFLTEEAGNQLKKFTFERLSDPMELLFTLKLIDLICDIPGHAENAADLMRAMIAK